MNALFDPRGNLPPPVIQPFSYAARRHKSNYLDYESKRSSNTLQKPKKKQCYDWIFSSSSNVHVAIDRAAFRKYVPFQSYVLTLSDQRRILVNGVGSVDVKIQYRPGSKAAHTITLDNVLHIPSWFCNIFSDVYFHTSPDYDFNWTDFGVIFTIQDKEKVKPWGYTESFCGLDRLVLSKRHSGRSPMLEDQEREVFSVSLTWPQSQQDKWELFMAAQVIDYAENLVNWENLNACTDEDGQDDIVPPRRHTHAFSQSKSPISPVEAGSGLVFNRKTYTPRSSSLRSPMGAFNFGL